MDLKETIAKVIIIGGKARAGKDTAGMYMKEYFENKNLKVKILGFADYIKMYAKSISSWDGSDETKPRTLLQELGTDIIRNKIDQDFFINRMIEDIKVYSFFYDTIIITDARIDREFIKLKEAFDDVISIYIERPNFENELENNEKVHLTETGLNNYNDYDYRIINDETLEDLKEKAINIVKEMY